MFYILAMAHKVLDLFDSWFVISEIKGSQEKKLHVFYGACVPPKVSRKFTKKLFTSTSNSFGS